MALLKVRSVCIHQELFDLALHRFAALGPIIGCMPLADDVTDTVQNASGGQIANYRILGAFTVELQQVASTDRHGFKKSPRRHSRDSDWYAVWLGTIKAAAAAVAPGLVRHRVKCHLRLVSI